MQPQFGYDFIQTTLAGIQTGDNSTGQRTSNTTISASDSSATPTAKQSSVGRRSKHVGKLGAGASGLLAFALGKLNST